ncbi:MAG TPA: nitrile hydratase subunit beta [Calditerricola sp.]
MAAYERCLVENGILSREELEARVQHFIQDPSAIRRLPKREDPVFKQELLNLVAEGYSTKREVNAPPKFKVGDHVVAVNTHPPGHTRLPRYVRGKRGVIERWHGAFIFPDTNAHGLGESPQHCYTVRFEAEEVWGRSATKGDAIYVDLWEPYLEPAEKDK